MSDKTAIEWCDATWNPLKGMDGNRWWCNKISPGCDHCYAARLNRRFGGEEYPYVGKDARPHGGIEMNPRQLGQPLSWQRPRRIFVCSMTDLFAEGVANYLQAAIFGVMAKAERHTFLVLTKRPRRMQQFLRDMPALANLPNVWLGVTVESNYYAWRAEVLKAVPAVVHFVSAEPLLGPLDGLDLRGIEWLIVGGESGGPPERRLVEPCCRKGSPFSAAPGECSIADAGECDQHDWRPKAEALAWVRDLRRRAIDADTAFFFKQWGGPTPKAGGRFLYGGLYSAFPEPRVVVG